MGRSILGCSFGETTNLVIILISYYIRYFSEDINFYEIFYQDLRKNMNIF